MIPMGALGPSTYGVGQASVSNRGSNGRKLGPNATASIARGEGLLAIAGAIVGLLGVLLPHPASFDELALILIQALTLAAALFLLAVADRVPRWYVSAMPALGVVLTSGAVIATGDATSGYALFYVWVAIISFYFLSRVETILQIAWAILNYGAVMIYLGAPPTAVANDELHRFVLMAGTLIAASVPLMYLRGRFDDLLERLSDAARTDLLTGLHNGRGLQEAVSIELERARLSGSKVSLLVADLDRFKDVNERLGHKTGDELLRRIGTMFDEATRRMDVVARTGG